MRILIVDDDALIRDSLKLIMDLEDGIDVVGTCADGAEACRFCETHDPPDIVLMDIRMPVMDGVKCTEKLRQKWPNLKVIVLTTFKDDEYIKEAIKNGAAGYLLKSQSSKAIVRTVHTVFDGSMVIGEEVATKLPVLIDGGQKKRKEPSFCDDVLTRREIDVLKLIAEGQTNKEIARALFF
ncbi:response regulator transcription factor [Terrilactibacillus sp. S3-3]|nr:response regulator transcription factor [Terrilactibacillus sp. S3-3]